MLFCCSSLAEQDGDIADREDDAIRCHGQAA
jgi:hypothetical protein